MLFRSLISQTYEELIKLTRTEEEEKKAARLKVPVYVVWDEFANGAEWDNIVNALTAGLSRGVRFCLVIQDFAQLNTRYGNDKAKTIRSNCQNLYYLLAGEYQTLKDISDLCGSRIVWNQNRQEKESVPVLSTDALSKLSMGEAVIIRQRRNPTLQRLRAFDQYRFHLPETPAIPEHKLPEAMIFDLKEEFEKKKPKKIKNADQKEDKQMEIEINGSTDHAADQKKVRIIRRHTVTKTKEISS